MLFDAGLVPYAGRQRATGHPRPDQSGGGVAGFERDCGVRKPRFLAPRRNDPHGRPVLYHLGSRIIEKRFVLGDLEKEKFLQLIRAYEVFSGCRANSYDLMDNHFHMELEVPPMPVGGLGDAELLRRLGALYPPLYVARVEQELAEARQMPVVDGGDGTECKVDGNGAAVVESDEDGAGQVAAAVAAIHARFEYRMHDLSQFMKGLLQRFTQWFNRMNDRRGTLWEGRFSSTLVEDGVGAKAVAAYGDLNPVRAGMVLDPRDYRWSSYGEAEAGGRLAQAGLVRVMLGHYGIEADYRLWGQGVGLAYRRLLMEGVIEKFALQPNGQVVRVRKGMNKEQAECELAKCGEISLGDLLHKRVGYFTAGVAVGSPEFLNELIASCPERFKSKRKDGAGKSPENGAPAPHLCSLRDLRKGI